MSNEQDLFRKLSVILLFIITFTFIGWSMPIVYATYTPADNIISVQNFDAQDATVNDETHYICFERTTNNDFTADLTLELFLIDESGRSIEVDRSRSEELLSKGPRSVIIEKPLPSGLESGQYKYEAIFKIDMANDRVTRTIKFNSETFLITEGQQTDSKKPIC